MFTATTPTLNLTLYGATQQLYRQLAVLPPLPPLPAPSPLGLPPAPPQPPQPLLAGRRLRQLPPPPARPWPPPSPPVGALPTPPPPAGSGSVQVAAGSVFDTLRVAPNPSLSGNASSVGDLRGVIVFSAVATFAPSAWGSNANLSVALSACGQGMTYDKGCTCVNNSLPSAKVASACTCQPGYFMSPSILMNYKETFTLGPVSQAWACKPCPSHAYCPGACVGLSASCLLRDHVLCLSCCHGRKTPCVSRSSTQS